MHNLLSFPPDANVWLSKDHFNPHTYWLWLYKVETIWFLLCLGSCKSIFLSLDPVAIKLVDQANELTLDWWPYKVCIFVDLPKSQISTNPWLVPIPICVPGVFQPKLVIRLGARSQNLKTLLLFAFHIYKDVSKATERIFWDDHSKRLR